MQHEAPNGNIDNKQAPNAHPLSELAEKFDPAAARKAKFMKEVFRNSQLTDESFVQGELGITQSRAYKGALHEMLQVEAKTKDSQYYDMLYTKKGDLTMLEHTTRLLRTFDSTFAQPLHDAEADSISSIVRQALKVRDMYKFFGPLEANNFMRNIDNIIPQDGRSLILETLSCEDLARAAYTDNPNGATKKEFQKWGERFDEKYSKGAAKLVEMVVDTINLEKKSRK
jgi:hypothetical protein